jgi:hypothetical protein
VVTIETSTLLVVVGRRGRHGWFDHVSANGTADTMQSFRVPSVRPATGGGSCSH